MIIESDWDEAPEWAEWWAIDWGGRAYWYEYEPTIIGTAWYLESKGMIKICCESDTNYPAWRQSLRRRPQ